MKNLLIISIALTAFISAYTIPNVNAQKVLNEVCISKEEKELYTLIMNYRKSKNLPVIPLSKSLTYVAQTHSKDLNDNNIENEKCNPHSWSDKGDWKSCCYYSDHRNTGCMWDKPKELTTYTGNGYEIAYYHSGEAKAAEALEGWKKSKGHNMVMVNLDMWKKVSWNAIGIGIYKNYATVWFGMEPDPAGSVSECSEPK